MKAETQVETQDATWVVEVIYTYSKSVAEGMIRDAVIRGTLSREELERVVNFLTHDRYDLSVFTDGQVIDMIVCPE